MFCAMPFRAKSTRLVSGALFFFLSLAIQPLLLSARAASFPVRPAGVAVNLLGDHFAIADFDGDKLPDLATVTLESHGLQSANYYIQLRLSSSAELAFSIRAPLGGLEIASRDVNGDDTMDLVVTSTRDAKLIAVLLNDGQGNFTFANPGAFPDEEPLSDLSISARVLGADVQITLCSYRVPSSEEGESFAGYAPQDCSNPASNAYKKALFGAIFHAHPGRAPPEPGFSS